MAITKMGTYRNPPEDITDYEAMVEKLDAYARTIGGQGMILTEWTNANEWPKLAMGSYIFHGGASYIVDTEDYTIGEPSDGTYYLRVMASGETLTVSWISSLDNYTWNPIYNGLYHADQSQILPYQLVVSGATVEKWKITNLAQGAGFVVANWQGSVRVAGSMNATGAISSGGAISGTHINTGQGDFKVGQNLRITDSPEFSSLKLSSSAYSSKTLSVNEVYYLPKGIYTVYAESHSTYVMLHLVALGGNTYSKSLSSTVIVVISNGSNAYIKNEYSSSRTFHMWKH